MDPKGKGVNSAQMEGSRLVRFEVLNGPQFKLDLDNWYKWMTWLVQFLNICSFNAQTLTYKLDKIASLFVIIHTTESI